MSDYSVSINSNVHTPRSECPFFLCCKKKSTKNKRAEPSVSELNYILMNKKDLLKLDSQTFINNNIFSSPFRVNSKTGNTSRIKTVNTIGQARNKGLNIIPRTGSVKRETDKEDKKFFHEFKDKLRCFFCGGRKCKHENFKTNSNFPNAIYGLNSNFITDDIIASQRPSEILITKYNLLSVFKDTGIGLIVNLQREGEHPYCGPNAYNLTSAGYSYNPSVFTGDDIRCKLSGWKDMSVPSSMNFMLDIVKEMSVVVKDLGKKVLVHCHAGYGRTGVVIACYMLFNSESDSDTIISMIREKRSKCIETKTQRSYCKKFEEFLVHSRIIFGAKENIDVYLKRQEDMLFGEESSKYGFVPKLITKTLERILSLKNKYCLENIVIYKLFAGVIVDWNEDLENVLVTMKNTLNKNNWELFDQTENLVILTELLFDWLEDCVEYVISPERTENILYSDLFVNYMNKSEEEKLKSFKNDELFYYIRKMYHCFEYEILYTFGSFFALFPPKGEEENQIFLEMLDRISLELLGFSLTEVNSDFGFMNSTKPLVTGLTTIIKLIFDSFSMCADEAESEAVTPIRKHSTMFSTKFKFSKKEAISRKDSGMLNSFNLLNNSLNKNSDQSLISSPSPLYKNIKNTLDPKEKKLFQMYEILNQHFQNKLNNEMTHTNNNTNIFNTLLLNQVSPFMMNPNEIIQMENMNNNMETPANISNKDKSQDQNSIVLPPRKDTELDQVVEEPYSKKENSSNESSSSEKVKIKESFNLDKDLQNIKNKFQSANSIINLKHVLAQGNNQKKSQSIISFETFQKAVLENDHYGSDMINHKPNILYRQGPSETTNSEGINVNTKLESLKRKSVVQEIKSYQRRNSVLGGGFKMRSVGYDFSKFKNRSDLHLIEMKQLKPINDETIRTMNKDIV